MLTYRCIYEDCNDTVTKEVLIEHELGENGKCRKTGCTYDICEQLTLEVAKNAEIAAGEAGYFKISLEAGIYGVNLTPAQGWTLEIFSADDVPVSLTPDGELPVSQAATYYFKLTNTAASAACSLLVFSVA